MIQRILGTSTVLLVAIAPVEAQTVQALPDTPAGRFVSVFLKAYNSANPNELERYNALYGRKTAPQDWIDMHAMTGRFTPVRIKSSGPNEITVLLSAEQGDALWEEKVKVDPADPMKILHAGIGITDRPPEFAIPRVPRPRRNDRMVGMASASLSAAKGQCAIEATAGARSE